MRTDFWLHPAPLPLTLPDNPDTRRRVVRTVARMGPWTNEEAGQIAEHPDLAGLVWALGVRHPRIRETVAWSDEAAAAVISAGVTDSFLLQRVAMAKERYWTVQVLAARLDLADPDLIARVSAFSDKRECHHTKTEQTWQRRLVRSCWWAVADNQRPFALHDTTHSMHVSHSSRSFHDSAGIDKHG